MAPDRINNILARPSGHHGETRADFRSRIKMKSGKRSGSHLRVFHLPQEIRFFAFNTFTNKNHLKESLLTPLRKLLQFKCNS